MCLAGLRLGLDPDGMQESVCVYAQYKQKTSFVVFLLLACDKHSMQRLQTKEERKGKGKKDMMASESRMVNPTYTAVDLPQKNGMVDTLQRWTFIASLVAQVVGLILTVVALLQSDTKPAMLMIILWLEAVVQGIEFLWYLIVGICNQFQKFDFDVSSRYVDWFFTTPTMLVSLLLFVFYTDCNTITMDMVWADSNKMWAIVVACAMNTLMLVAGLLQECKYMGVGRRWIWILIGSAFFILAFVPIGVAVAHKGAPETWAALITTIVVWAMYGVAAFVFRKDTLPNTKWKNTAYNVLDVVSKNVFAIIISVIVFSYQSSDAVVQSNTTCV